LNIEHIQSFIFETGKLNEIVGASEFVEHLCTTRFRNAVPNFKEDNLLLGAAGKVRYVFDDRTYCQQFVRNFSQQFKTEVPDLNISEAVVEFSESITKEVLDLLDDRLEIQRNKRGRQHGIGLMICHRAPLTPLELSAKTREGEPRPQPRLKEEN